MTMDVARFKARQSAYQWRMPCWIVLDALERGLRLFCGPHAEYLEGEIVSRSAPVPLRMERATVWSIRADTLRTNPFSYPVGGLP